MTMKLTIIGAGPGGYAAAIRAAQKGAAVTLIEESEVGGNCLNRGCIPTKTLIASAEALEHVRHASEFGIEFPGEASYNLRKIRDRKDAVVALQVKGIRNLLKARKVRLLEGRGHVLSHDRVRVVLKKGDTEEIDSNRIIIATGSRPASLSGISFDHDSIIASDDAIMLKKIPQSIVIVGAGVIGCEFAFMYRTLGAEVTLVEMLPRSLWTEDEDMAAMIEREFKKRKIELIASARVTSISKNAENTTDVYLEDGRVLTTESVLVSIGRKMNTEDLGLENVGITLGKYAEIPVNEQMETSAPGIYAIGDVTNKILLAHVAYHQGLVAVENALGGTATMDYSVVPSGVFTMPEIGSVGLREHEAIERKISYRVGKFPYRILGKAHAMGEIVGLVKIISEETTDRVLGVHICGAHASDMVHEGALAIKMGATSKQLGNMIHAHPTLSEAIMEAAENVHGISIHLMR